MIKVKKTLSQSCKLDATLIKFKFTIFKFIKFKNFLSMERYQKKRSSQLIKLFLSLSIAKNIKFFEFNFPVLPQTYPYYNQLKILQNKKSPTSYPKMYIHQNKHNHVTEPIHHHFLNVTFTQ